MILIVIGCSQKPGQRFVFSPEKPLAGQKISVAYNPTTTPLEKADQVQIVVYEFSNSMTPTAHEVETTKKGKSWKGTFVPDSSVLLVLVKFQSDEKVDINDPDGYKILFYDDAGNTLPGVHAALANVYFTGAFPIRIKRNEAKALELIEKAGISLPKTQVDDRLEKEKEAIYFVNRWAANFFYKNLFSPAGKDCLHYVQSRGINREMIKTFGLGYSLNDWDGLIKQAQKDSVALDVLFKSGLIIKRSGGGFYDRFRGRFMIPIVDLYKKVLGFGGRKMVDDDSPKYINSPETPIYQKGQILFGLYQSRETIKQQDQAIFVEGYTDLISLFQAGIKNVVATSGTALTASQAKLIRRFTENVILLYDADTSGSLAAIRGADIFLDEGLEVKIVTLPTGHDPDSYVRERGVDYFKQTLSRAKSIIHFKIDTLSKKLDISSTQGKTQLVNSLLESITRIKDNIKQNLALKEVAEHFRLDERALMEQLHHIKKK